LHLESLEREICPAGVAILCAEAAPLLLHQQKQLSEVQSCGMTRADLACRWSLLSL
jgi:hypothetical protein